MSVHHRGSNDATV